MCFRVRKRMNLTKESLTVCSKAMLTPRHSMQQLETRILYHLHLEFKINAKRVTLLVRLGKQVKIKMSL